jgi:hypothetical protein
MKTPIKLQRSLVLQGWRVTGTIAFATKREWEPAVLKLAVQRGELTSAVVVSELLGGRTGVARRLLDICTGLGLLEYRHPAWVPTAAGHAAATSGRVLLPERGTWTLWGCDDPLLPDPIVAVLPWKEPPAYEERSRDVARPITALPPWLIRTTGQQCAPLAGKYRSVRVDELGKEQKGEAVAERPSLRLTLTVAPNEARVRVTGLLGEERVDAEVPPPRLTHEQVWTTLLQRAGLADRWDPQRRALLEAFNATTASERSTVERVVRVEHPELAGAGRFETAAIDHVPLRPRSKADAAEWAEWRLVQSLQSYLIGDTLESAYREAAKPFVDLAPSCPPRDVIAARLRGLERPPPAYWRVQAPSDWSLAGREIR